MTTEHQFEKLLIGALLHRPEAMLDLNVATEMFVSPVYQQAFDMLLASDREAIDIFDIADRLERTTTNSGWLQLLTGAMQECYAPNNVTLYANKIRQAFQARRARDIAAQLINSVKDDGVESIDVAIRDLMELGMERRNFEMSLKQALQESVDHIDKVYNSAGALAGITSGLIDLDDMLGGFHDGDLIILAARPSMGKTAMLLNLALNANVSSGIISSEQPGMQMATRLIAINGRVNANNLRNAKRLTDDDWPKITASVSQLTDRNIRINDKSGIVITELMRQARSWVHNHDMKILFVDYVQRIKATNTRAMRHEQVAEVIMQLKELARQLNIPVVALAQVNREVEKRMNKRPTMADIKDSGSIEQEGDIVMSLYRDEVYNPETQDVGIAEVDILKNRHGPIGFRKIVWQAQYMRFRNHTMQDEWGGPEQ